MPTLSVYAFDRSHPSLAGPFFQNHVGHGAGGWAWVNIYNMAKCRSVLSWERPDSEVIIDLSDASNQVIVLNTIDGLLASPASRKGPVRTSYVTWANVHPAVKAANPNLHKDWELLVTINIDFHVKTPWYCSDADGTITYYVFFYVDGGGHVHGDVQGWSYYFSGGGPFCVGSIKSSLNSGVPPGMGKLQGLINVALTLYAGGKTFSMIYLLPGRGVKSGFSGDNADNNVALALLPH